MRSSLILNLGRPEEANRPLVGGAVFFLFRAKLAA